MLKCYCICLHHTRTCRKRLLRSRRVWHYKIILASKELDIHCQISHTQTNLTMYHDEPRDVFSILIYWKYTYWIQYWYNGMTVMQIYLNLLYPIIFQYSQTYRNVINSASLQYNSTVFLLALVELNIYSKVLSPVAVVNSIYHFLKSTFFVIHIHWWIFFHENFSLKSGNITCTKQNGSFIKNWLFNAISKKICKHIFSFHPSTIKKIYKIFLS